MIIVNSIRQIKSMTIILKPLLYNERVGVGGIMNHIKYTSIKTLYVILDFLRFYFGTSQFCAYEFITLVPSTSGNFSSKMLSKIENTFYIDKLSSLNTIHSEYFAIN